MTAPANVRTCYRHPDRAAGIVCQRCDRPICPACMQQASVGFHCPECARSGAQKVYQGAAALVQKPIATQVLIGVNLLVFIAMLATSNVAPFSPFGELIANQTSFNGLFADGALWGPAVPDEPWRLLTGGFLHSYGLVSGLIHVASNMWALWIFGQLLERSLGRTRFVTLYFTSLFGGALGVVLLDPRSLTIGASGAVFGLFAAAFVVLHARGVDIRKTGLIPVLVINVFITFSGFVSVGGHLGGFVAGALAAGILVYGPKQLGPRGELVSTLVTAGMGVAYIVIAYGLMVTQYG